MDLTAPFNMSLKMAPNETCQSVSYLCAYQVCLGDVSQCCRQWGGVAICRGKLGVANHSSCLTLCCLSSVSQAVLGKSRCSARTQHCVTRTNSRSFACSSPPCTACRCPGAYPRGSCTAECIPLASLAVGSKAVWRQISIINSWF